MSAGTVLVTGATGAVGRHVVDGLLAAGRAVRALTRDPDRARLPAGVDVRRGDLADPGALRVALDDVAQLHLFPGPDTVLAAGAARTAGVTHVVLLSSASAVHAEDGQDVPGALAAMAVEHRAAERAVERAGLSHTFLRPGPFMGNDLVWAPEVRTTRTVSVPHLDAASAPVDERDVAGAAVAALQDPHLLPDRLLLTGPESLTQRERIVLIGEAIGVPVRPVELSPAEARVRWAGLPDGGADHILDILAHAPATAPVAPEPGAYGLRRRTYREWLRTRRPDFTTP